MTTEKVNIHTILQDTAYACKSATTSKDRAMAFVKELKLVSALTSNKMHFSVVFWRINGLDDRYQMRHMMSADYDECRLWLDGIIEEFNNVEKRVGKQFPISILAYIDDELEESDHLASLWT